MTELPVLTDAKPAGGGTGIDDTASMLRAIADPVRARISDLLAREQLCVAVVVGLIPLSASVDPWGAVPPVAITADRKGAP